MGSITLVVEKMHEFNPDERERNGGEIITRSPAEAQANRRSYRLHKSVCWDCGTRKASLVHRQDVTVTFTVPDCVEEMYETAQKADSSFFDVAEETKKRRWGALAVLSHVSDPDRQGRACMSEEDRMMSDVNWATAVAWFTEVKDAKWCKYTSPHAFFGSSEIILFDPSHPWTAEVAGRIGDILGLDSGNVVLDEDALQEAKNDQLVEALGDWLGRGRVPDGFDYDALIPKLRAHSNYLGDDSSITQEMVSEVVKEIPHTYEEGFDQVDPEDDDSAYLCVCGLPQEHEMHTATSEENHG